MKLSYSSEISHGIIEVLLPTGFFWLLKVVCLQFLGQMCKFVTFCCRISILHVPVVSASNWRRYAGKRREHFCRTVMDMLLVMMSGVAAAERRWSSALCEWHCRCVSRTVNKCQHEWSTECHLSAQQPHPCSVIIYVVVCVSCRVCVCRFCGYSQCDFVLFIYF